MRSWIYRATVIQGTQQLLISFLWYWGSWMASLNQKGTAEFSLAMTNPHALLGIGIGLAVLLWLLGALVFFGLPSYYRQTSGQVPTFYLSLFRRRIILVCLFRFFPRLIVVLTGPCSGSFTWCSYLTIGCRRLTDETGSISGPASMPKCGKLRSLSSSFSSLSGRQLSGCSMSFPRDMRGSFQSLPSVSVPLGGLRCCGLPRTLPPIYPGQVVPSPGLSLADHYGFG